jgi:hypothetical protein
MTDPQTESRGTRDARLVLPTLPTTDHPPTRFATGRAASSQVRAQMSQLEREMAAKEGRVLGMRAELESLESFIGQWKAGAEDSPQPDDYLMQMVPRPTTHDPLPQLPHAYGAI